MEVIEAALRDCDGHESSMSRSDIEDNLGLIRDSLEEIASSWEDYDPSDPLGSHVEKEIDRVLSAYADVLNAHGFVMVFDVFLLIISPVRTPENCV